MMNKDQIQQQIDHIYETQFWTPCTSKKQLQEWIRTFLNIDLPAEVVDDELSNSCPMDFIWDIYYAALTGDESNTTFVAAAARNGMKTLSAAIIEFLMMIHFGRDIVHMAALVSQSEACIKYLNRFLKLPLVSKFSSTDNKKRKTIEGTPVSPVKPFGEATLQVIVATIKGTNSSRASVILYDELDLIDRDILSESAMIADPSRDGKPPIFIYLSSRKSAVGPVQEKIDASEKPNSMIKLHKWNVTEFMKPCPPETHRPDLPMQEVFIHPESLEVKNHAEVEVLPQSMAAQYEKLKVFDGCVACPALVACRSKSALRQKNYKPLRSIGFIASAIREVSEPEKINAQLLNRKPESGGTVFNKFSREKNVKNLQSMYEFCFSVEAPSFLTKETLIKELKNAGWRIHCGVDFGWIDMATAVLVAYNKSNDKCVVLHTESSTGMSPEDWLKHVKRTVYLPFGFDLLCPDLGAGKHIPSVASNLGMPCRNEKPPKIQTGVDWLRARIWNVSNQEVQFAMLDDGSPNTATAIKQMQSWQYEKTQMGFNFNMFADDDNTHFPDAIRYAIDLFIPKHASTLSANQNDNVNTNKPAAVDTAEGMQRLIKEHLYREFGIDLSDENKEKTSVSAGGVIISF